MTNEYEKGRKPKDSDPGKPQTHPGIQGPRTDLRKFLYQHHCCPARAPLITLINAPSARAPADTKKKQKTKNLATSPEGARTKKIGPTTNLKPLKMRPGNLKFIYVVVIHLSATALILLGFSQCRCRRWCTDIMEKPTAASRHTIRRVNQHHAIVTRPTTCESCKSYITQSYIAVPGNALVCLFLDMNVIRIHTVYKYEDMQRQRNIPHATMPPLLVSTVSCCV